mgnify:FL=1
MSGDSPRLAPEFYRGQSYIHWTHTVQGRRQGWLNPEFHFIFRERLFHTCVRYHLCCMSYVLMPDHIHLLWIGTKAETDQLKATKFLRKHTPIEWQKQAHDHVLLEKDRTRDALTRVSYYLRENPVRAGIVQNAKDWPYFGSLVPGFPDIDPSDQDSFWRCFLANSRKL